MPSPAEILQTRIELHLARGEAFAAERLRRKLRETPRWTLEELEAGDRPLEAMSDDARGWSLQQLGLPMKVCGAFEQYGVLWVRELLHWTEERMLLAPGLRGPTTRNRVKQALARVGLALRTPTPDEPSEPLPPRVELARRRSFVAGLSESRTRTIVRMLASGVSQRQINLALGYAAGAHWAAWRVNQRLKQMLAAGYSPSEIAEHLGLEPRSSSWDQAVEYFGRLLPNDAACASADS